MKLTKLFLTWLLGALLVLGLLVPLALEANAEPLDQRTTARVVVNYGPESIVVSGTQTLTPTRSLMVLNNPTTLTATLAVGGAIEGDQLIVISEVVTATLILATNTSLAATLTLTQNDSTHFVLANSQWVQISVKDNAAD